MDLQTGHPFWKVQDIYLGQATQVQPPKNALCQSVRHIFFGSIHVIQGPDDDGSVAGLVKQIVSSDRLKVWHVLTYEVLGWLLNVAKIYKHLGPICWNTCTVTTSISWTTTFSSTEEGNHKHSLNDPVTWLAAAQAGQILVVHDTRRPTGSPTHTLAPPTWWTGRASW